MQFSIKSLLVFTGCLAIILVICVTVFREQQQPKMIIKAGYRLHSTNPGPELAEVKLSIPSHVKQLTLYVTESVSELPAPPEESSSRQFPPATEKSQAMKLTANEIALSDGTVCIHQQTDRVTVFGKDAQGADVFHHEIIPEWSSKSNLFSRTSNSFDVVGKSLSPSNIWTFKEYSVNRGSPHHLRVLTEHKSYSLPDGGMRSIYVELMVLTR